MQQSHGYRSADVLRRALRLNMILFRRSYEHALALATAVLQDLQP